MAHGRMCIWPDSFYLVEGVPGRCPFLACFCLCRTVLEPLIPVVDQISVNSYNVVVWNIFTECFLARFSLVFTRWRHYIRKAANNGQYNLCCRNVLYSNPAAKECVEVFLTHAIRPVMLMIQISGHNRARQRDKWARLLEEFAALQDEV